jgi:hypothetical protein
VEKKTQMDGKKHNYKSSGKQKSADMTKKVSGFSNTKAVNKRASKNKTASKKKK